MYLSIIKETCILDKFTHLGRLIQINPLHVIYVKNPLRQNMNVLDIEGFILEKNLIHVINAKNHSLTIATYLDIKRNIFQV